MHFGGVPIGSPISTKGTLTFFQDRVETFVDDQDHDLSPEQTSKI